MFRGLRTKSCPRSSSTTATNGPLILMIGAGNYEKIPAVVCNLELDPAFIGTASGMAQPGGTHDGEAVSAIAISRSSGSMHGSGKLGALLDADLNVLKIDGVATAFNDPDSVVLYGQGHVPTQLGDDVLPLTQNRNGTWYSCMFHNITAMVGAGVLGLPSTFAYLGWAGGIATLLASLVISWYTFVLLCRMHEASLPHDSEAPGEGKRVRFNRYIELSNYALGVKWGWIIQPFQFALLWGICITYTVTGGQSLLQVYNNHGGNHVGLSVWIVIFASVCLLLSQIKNFGELMLVSAMGAAVTLIYCGIAVIMSGVFPAEPRSAVSYATAQGKSTVSAIFGTFNAITTMCFAFGGHNIALEIQASLPGGTNKADTTIPRMLIGVHTAFVFACIAYLLVSIVGFWAFGNTVSGNVIFSLGGPVWVQSLAALSVVLHVLATIQVLSFPIYDVVESHLVRRGYTVKWLLRTCLRTTFVVVTALVACLLPFFGALMGLVGAVGITPTTFVYPCILWLILRRPSWRTVDFWACWFVTITITLVGVLGSIGAIREIVLAAGSFKVFQ